MVIQRTFSHGVYRGKCFVICVEPVSNGVHGCFRVTDGNRAHNRQDCWAGRAEAIVWKSGNIDVDPIISEPVEVIIPKNSVFVEPSNVVIHGDNPRRARISTTQMIPNAFSNLCVSSALVFSNESENIIPIKRI